MIHNVHQRTMLASASARAELIDGLASTKDALWPGDRWPQMYFDRPLMVGAIGGHGDIRYTVESYEPGCSITFRFDPSIGLTGTHSFVAVDLGDGRMELTHRLDGEASGAMRLAWPLAIRWMHDAVVEDAFDNAEAVAAQRPVQRRPFTRRVRFLRAAMMTIRRSQEPAAALAPRRAVSISTAATLGGIGLIHVAWAIGTTWPAATQRDLARLVVGTNQMPPAAASAAVATLLGFAAWLVEQRTTVDPVLPPGLVDLGTKTLAAVLALRGAGGLVMSALSGNGANLPFRRANLLMYSPLCLALAWGAWSSAGGGQQTSRPVTAAPADNQRNETARQS